MQQGNEWTKWNKEKQADIWHQKNDFVDKNKWNMGMKWIGTESICITDWTRCAQKKGKQHFTEQ